MKVDDFFSFRLIVVFVMAAIVGTFLGYAALIYIAAHFLKKIW